MIDENGTVIKKIRAVWKPTVKVKHIKLIHLWDKSEFARYRLDVYSMGTKPKSEMYEKMCIGESYFIIYNTEKDEIVSSDPPFNTINSNTGEL